MKRWRAFLVPGALVVAVLAFALVSLDSGDDDDVEPVLIEAAGPTFATIGEMAAAADLVVEATVIADDDGRTLTDPANPDAGLRTRLYQLAVDDVLVGETGDAVLVEQEHQLLDGTPIIVNGLTPHSIGDSGLWFLVVGDSEEFPFTAVINEQGRVLVDTDGTVDTDLLPDGSPLDQLRAATLGR